MELKKIYNRPTIMVFETHIECPLLDSSQDDHADSKQQRFVFEDEEDEPKFEWGSTWNVDSED